MSQIPNTDPAMSKSNFDRIDNDFYPTPSWITKNAIMIMEDEMILRSDDLIWECADGQGHISDVFKKHGYNVLQTDLNPQLEGVATSDFLKEYKTYHSGMIFTNPPYGPLAEEFIRHALKLMKGCQGKVGMILRNEFDCGKNRMDIFSHHPAFRAKIVLTTRPRWIEGTTGSPRHNFSIFIWDWAHTGPAELFYMNKNSDLN